MNHSILNIIRIYLVDIPEPATGPATDQEQISDGFHAGISGQVEIFRADREELVREFCERKTRKAFLKGAAFYELTKTEPKVQDYKQIAIRDRKTNAVYAGEAARDLLGLPRRGTARVVPGDHSAYDVFVQSTSVNRKLPAGSRLLYWPKAGVPYVEGVSAPYDRR